MLSTEQVPRIEGAPENYIDLRKAEIDLSVTGRSAIGLDHIAGLVLKASEAFSVANKEQASVMDPTEVPLAVSPLENALENLRVMRDDVRSQPEGKFPNSYIVILERSLAIARGDKDAEPVGIKDSAEDLQILSRRFKEQALEHSAIERVFGTHWRAVNSAEQGANE